MKFPSVQAPTRTRTTSVTKHSSKKAQRPKQPNRGRSESTSQTTRTRAAVRRGPKIVGPRPASKTARILALLKRPQGVGLKELLKATGWQPHSIRGFLSGTVVGRMGLKVSSTKSESGERRYAVKP